METWHKWANTYIFESWRRGPLVFKTMNSVRSTNWRKQPIKGIVKCDPAWKDSNVWYRFNWDFSTKVTGAFPRHKKYGNYQNETQLTLEKLQYLLNSWSVISGLCDLWPVTFVTIDLWPLWPRSTSSFNFTRNYEKITCPVT